MFKPSTIKTASYVSLVCCALGIVFALFEAITMNYWVMYIIVISWALLLYSSYLGTKLATFELYDEDMKKLGWYVYGILALFVMFIFTNLAIGILPALLLTIKLHQQKSGFDTWMEEKVDN